MAENKGLDCCPACKIPFSYWGKPGVFIDDVSVEPNMAVCETILCCELFYYCPATGMVTRRKA